MKNFYRVISYNPADIKETRSEFAGIYRGTKHDTAKEKSSNPQHGVYRGVKWVA